MEITNKCAIDTSFDMSNTEMHCIRTSLLLCLAARNSKWHKGRFGNKYALPPNTC